MDYTITVSPKAAEEIKKKLLARGTPNSYIRLGVKGGGCVGFTYQFEYADSDPTDRDLLFISEEVKIIVDKKSILYLNGTQLDWRKSLMFTGFKFVNPLEQSSCSCGHSVVINKEQL